MVVEAFPAHASSAEDPVPILTAQSTRLADAAPQTAPAMGVEDLGVGMKPVLGVPEQEKSKMNSIQWRGERLLNLSPP